ncbi:hypothetical protein GFB94_02720, partial [Escherichia coli]|nr:hypothetical protein [Escherichia coli]
DCPLTDFGGKTSIFSHPVYLFLRKFSLQDSRGGSLQFFEISDLRIVTKICVGAQINGDYCRLM